MESGLEPKKLLIGSRCLATLGPDDQPNEKVVVIVLAPSSAPETFLCEEEATKRLLIVRERKLKPI